MGSGTLWLHCVFIYVSCSVWTFLESWMQFVPLFCLYAVSVFVWGAICVSGKMTHPFIFPNNFLNQTFCKLLCRKKRHTCPECSIYLFFNWLYNHSICKTFIKNSCWNFLVWCLGIIPHRSSNQETLASQSVLAAKVR